VLCKGKREKGKQGNTKVKTGSCFPLDGQTLLCLDLRVWVVMLGYGEIWMTKSIRLLSRWKRGRSFQRIKGEEGRTTR
jgi:hypothetical protein